MNEVNDPSTGAILFKKTSEEKSIENMANEIRDMHDEILRMHIILLEIKKLLTK